VDEPVIAYFIVQSHNLETHNYIYKHMGSNARLKLLAPALLLSLFILYLYFPNLPSTAITAPAMPALKHLKISPKEAHTATIIFLHVRHTLLSVLALALSTFCVYN
jgi:hypothetical protein